MATMNFSVPGDVKARFNELFADRNKSAVVTELLRDAIDREERRRQAMAAAAQIIANQAHAARSEDAELRVLRQEGRP